MRRLASSDRRLATLGLLALASAGCVGLVWVRAERTGTGEYGFLLWNLFLAWLPLLSALGLYDGYRRGWGRAPLVALGGLWLLFLPNAPYILTDVVHLQEPGAAPLWYDALTVMAFAATGLLLGLGSLFLVQAVVTTAGGRAAGWAVSLAALVLCSVGVYLGRFVGVNSWDVLADPERVLEPFRDRLQDPLAGGRFVVVTGVLTAGLVLAYVLLWNVAHLGGLTSVGRRRPAPPRHPGPGA